MKNAAKFLSLLLACMMLSGCVFKSGDDLLVAPKPTKNYLALQNELDAILRTGAVYASPESGENRNTVQLMDMDNDGEEEAISFFRESTLSNKFTVYIHKKIGDQYIRMGSVSGTGTAIQSVSYPSFSAAGERGMVIAWRLAGESAKGLTVCAFENGKLFSVLETDYTAFELPDLNEDGLQELVTVTADPQGKKHAQMYQYKNGAMPLVGEAPLIAEGKSIQRVTDGYAAGHQPAVFVETKGETNVGLTTDVLLLDQDGFRNLALEAEQSAAYSTYRPMMVYATDINGDGITEIPRAHLAAGYVGGAADAQYLLDWYAYGEQTPALVRTTYHSLLEEWMFTAPEGWHDTITIRKATSTPGIMTTTFEQWNPDGTTVPLLRIYCLTGDMRGYLAMGDGMIRLRETGKATYTAQIPAEAAGNPLALSQAEIEQRFGLISQDWAN